MGSDYWKGLLDWIRSVMLGEGMISREDMELFRVLDEPEEIVQYIRKFVIV